MQTTHKTCTRCGSAELFATYVTSNAYSTNFLPGLAGRFLSARFKICVCADCGLVEWNVPAEYLPKLRQKWARESDI